jgi:hypothetical protein
VNRAWTAFVGAAMALLAVSHCRVSASQKALEGDEIVVDGVNWKEDHAWKNELLTSNVELALVVRVGTVRPRVGVVMVKQNGKYIPVHTVTELLPFLNRIDTSARAYRYGELLRLLGSVEGVIGKRLDQHPGYPDFPGRDGSYTEADASRWRIPFESKVDKSSGRWIVEVPVVVQDKLKGDSPTVRVVLLRESIGEDGSYDSRAVRVLEEGKDAERYVPRGA